MGDEKRSRVTFRIVSAVGGSWCGRSEYCRIAFFCFVTFVSADYVMFIPHCLPS